MFPKLKRLILCIALGWSSLAQAGFSSRSDIFLFGDARYLNQHQFSEYESLLEFSGAAGVDITYHYRNFEFIMRPELRWINSSGVGVDPEDISYVSVLGPKRYFNLGGEIKKTSIFQAVVGFEKLSMSIQTEHLEFAVGRRPLGLGVLKFLPVWNKFTVVLPNQSGPPYLYNPDDAILRYQTGPWSGALLEIAGPRDEDAVGLGQLNYFGEWIEIQTLFGNWWQDAVAGFAFTKDISGVTLRMESLWVGLNPEDQEHFCQIGAGLEYAFTEKFSVTFENLYLQNGANDSNDYQLTPPSRFSPFRASRYGLLSLEYKFLPNWRLIAGPFANLVDGSSLVLADLRWSASDDSEMVLQTKIPMGPYLTEFSPKAFTFEDGSYVGYPYIITLLYKSYF
jgi:hypothetical protein